MTDASPGQAGVSPLFEGLHAESALHEVLDATRALLWIGTPADAAEIAGRLVVGLGGAIVRAGESGDEALPVDVSFGQGHPVLAAAAPASVARMLLERHLPVFIRDANRALELVERTARLAEDASVDPLTHLANRRMIGRALGRLGPQNTVIMIDLDHFKAVNDTLGHPQGDLVLQVLGRTLAACLRATDRAGRYGGEEFVVILASGDPEPFLQRLRSLWTDSRPHPVTFSAGIAPARPNPATALRAADLAMYRAKLGGRDQWQHAIEEDYQ